MIVYAKFNDTRKKEFRLSTTFESKNGNLIVNKRPAAKEATPFLYSLLDKYELLSKANTPFTIIKAYRSEEQTVSFEYHENQSLQAKMLDHLKKGNAQGLEDGITFYTKLIRSMRSETSKVSEDFSRIFSSNFDKQTQCINVGCLDLNFDNILTTSDKPILIDYEWTFDFPIPADFIIFRAIYGFYANSISFFPNSLLPLKTALSIAELSEDDFIHFLIFENQFQAYVSGQLTGNNIEHLKSSFESFCVDKPKHLSKVQLLSSYAALLETESQRKNDWILVIEKGILEKDIWIKTLEQNHRDLTRAIIEIDRNLIDLGDLKNLNSADNKISLEELKKLTSYVAELEKLCKVKSQLIENLENTVQGQNQNVRRHEENSLLLSADLRKLDEQYQQLRLKIDDIPV